jgi:transposase InsO family protein
VVPDSLSRCFVLRRALYTWDESSEPSALPSDAAAVRVLEAGGSAGAAASQQEEDGSDVETQDSDGEGAWRKFLADDDGNEPAGQLAGVGDGDEELGVGAVFDARQVAAARRLATQSIVLVHNCVAGHLGVAPTLRALKAAGLHWSAMTTDVQRFVAACPVCQKLRGKPRRGAAANLRVTGGVFRHLMVDFMGPFTETCGGHEYIFVMQCRFSRFIEAYATQDQSSRAAAICCVDFFGRYGIPDTMQSDNASQLKSTFVGELCTMVGVTQQFGPPYHSQSQGTVERVNSEVMRHLRALVWNAAAYTRWNELLPFAQRIINATVHSATGVAPAALVFGGRLDLSRRILRPSEDYESGAMTDWAHEMQQNQVEMEMLSEHRDAEISDRRTLLRGPISGVEPMTFRVDDMVLVWPPHGIRREKMAPLWLGPFKVVRRVADGSTRWVLSDVRKPGKEKVVSIGEMKPFTEALWQELWTTEQLREVDYCRAPVTGVVAYEFRPKLQASRGPKLGTRQSLQLLWLQVTVDSVAPQGLVWVRYSDNVRAVGLRAFSLANPTLRIPG